MNQYALDVMTETAREFGQHWEPDELLSLACGFIDEIDEEDALDKFRLHVREYAREVAADQETEADRQRPDWMPLLRETHVWDTWIDTPRGRQQICCWIARVIYGWTNFKDDPHEVVGLPPGSEGVLHGVPQYLFEPHLQKVREKACELKIELWASFIASLRRMALWRAAQWGSTDFDRTDSFAALLRCTHDSDYVAALWRMERDRDLEEFYRQQRAKGV